MIELFNSMRKLELPNKEIPTGTYFRKNKLSNNKTK